MSSNHTVPRVARSVGLNPVRVRRTCATPGGTREFEIVKLQTIHDEAE